MFKGEVFFSSGASGNFSDAGRGARSSVLLAGSILPTGSDLDGGSIAFSSLQAVNVRAKTKQT